MTRSGINLLSHNASRFVLIIALVSVLLLVSYQLMAHEPSRTTTTSVATSGTSAGVFFGESDYENVVLIGWDGTQRDHLKEMIARGEVPNLMSLVKEGRLVDIDVTTGATDTKAGWSQILTGYSPEKTGVFSNSKYQPIPLGYTIFERLENYLGPENIVTIAIIGKEGHVDADGPTKILFDKWAKSEEHQGYKVPKPTIGTSVRLGGRIVEENGTIYVAFPGKPYFYSKDHMDMFLNGLGENEKVGATALENLEKYKNRRFFFFIHFAYPDHSGHKYGENSQEYTNAIISDDDWTGRIIDRLKQLDLYSKTLVYVTADHGFDEGKTSHSYAPFVFLATNDPKVNRNGDRADIAPTILERFGIDFSKIEPPLDGRPLDEPAASEALTTPQNLLMAAGEQGCQSRLVSPRMTVVRLVEPPRLVD